jgi:hypothetical protein
MELDELKKTWNHLEEEANYADSFDPKVIQRLMKSGYKKRLKHLLLPEIFIAVSCFYFAALFGLMFSTLETTLLENLGRMTILILLPFPVIRLALLWQFYHLGKTDKVYSETLRSFSQLKIKIQKLQQISIGLGFMLIVIIAILLTKIYNEYDVTQGKYFWIITTVIGISFSIIFYRYVVVPYNQSIQVIERLLNDLEATK